MTIEQMNRGRTDDLSATEMLSLQTTAENKKQGLTARSAPEALARRYEFFPLRCSGGVLKHFGLWTWMLSQEERFPEIISGEALEAIREEHQRTA